ncbi:CCA tRNA nucleotidyltransferase [Melioribacteraceae bacterium 4301-Me]|uniref:CCA tRNA nucleotidyltransferase n=1 Tax=Pyranulibacter aquaticus TaxID=3163344 RepID=UPI00359A9BCF
MQINLENKITQIQLLHKISQLAKERNEKVFLVGGFVRDLLLNRIGDELDILIVGDGPQFAEQLAKQIGIKTVTVYKNFGTAQFKYENYTYEFVGARKESYSRASRNPIVEKGTLDDDINRRDFTINTLAISLNAEDFGLLYDKFNSLDDIRNQIIKTPLDPYKTFDDDPLRILRAFRFASQLQFEIDESVLEAAEKMAERLKIVAQERITDEFLKILSSAKPSIGLKYLQKTKVMNIVFPEIANLEGVEQRKDFHHKDVFYHTLIVVDNISAITDNIWLRFAALVHDIAKPQTKKFIEGIGWTFHGHEEIGARMMKEIFNRMKLPHSKLPYVEKLVKLHLRPIALVDDQVTDSAIRRLIVAAGDDLDDLIKLCRADITSKNQSKVNKYLENYEKVMNKVHEVLEKDKLRAFQSPVRGDVIMQVCNLKPSKKVGEIKSAIEEAILEGKIANNFDEAYNYLLKIKDKFLSSES